MEGRGWAAGDLGDGLVDIMEVLMMARMIVQIFFEQLMEILFLRMIIFYYF